MQSALDMAGRVRASSAGHGPRGVENGVGAELVETGWSCEWPRCRCDRQAVCLLEGVVEEAGFGAAAWEAWQLAQALAHRRVGRVRPGIQSGPVPGLVGEPVGRIGPIIGVVTLQAEGGGIVVLDQELAVLIVVGVVAGGALHLAGVVEAHLVVQGRGITQLAVGSRQGAVIDKGDRVIVGEVGSEIGRSGRHGGDCIAHFNGNRPAVNHSQRNGSIMAAQAEFGGAGGLADGGFDGRAAVRDVGRL